MVRRFDPAFEVGAFVAQLQKPADRERLTRGFARPGSNTRPCHWRGARIISIRAITVDLSSCKLRFSSLARGVMPSSTS